MDPTEGIQPNPFNPVDPSYPPPANSDPVNAATDPLVRRIMEESGHSPPIAPHTFSISTVLIQASLQAQAESIENAIGTAQSIDDIVPPSSPLSEGTFSPDTSRTLMEAARILTEDNSTPAYKQADYDLAMALLISKNIHEGESIIEPIDKMADALVGLTDKYGVSMLQGTIGPLEHIQGLANSITLDLTLGSLLFKAPESIGKGGALLYKRVIMNRIRAQLAIMKKNNPTDEQKIEIKRIEVWLMSQEEEIQEQAISWGLGAINLFPMAAKVFLSTMGAVTPIASTALAGGTVVTSAAVLAWQLSQDVSNRNIQAKHTERLRNNLSEIEGLLASRPPPPSEAKLNDYVQLRADVTKVALTKQENEKKFFDFKIGTSSAAFSITTIAGILIVTFKILAIVGVFTVATSALAYTGVGIAVLAVGLMAAGIIFLYIYKPHLFKSLAMGVQARLTLMKIPKNIAKFRATKKRAELSLITQSAEVISVELANQERLLHLYFMDRLEVGHPDHEYQSKIKKLDDREIKDLEIRIDLKRKSWDEKKLNAQKELDLLKEKVEQWRARTKELQMRALLSNLNDVKGVSLEQISSLTDRIVDGLNDSTLDDKTKKTLSTTIGLDIEKIRNKGVTPERVKKNVLKYFSLSDKAMVQHIRRQEAHLKHLYNDPLPGAT